MEKQKSQTALFKFGFKRSLNHRGMVINTAQEVFVKNPNAGLFKCKGCKAGVKTRTSRTRSGVKKSKKTTRRVVF